MAAFDISTESVVSPTHLEDRGSHDATSAMLRSDLLLSSLKIKKEEEEYVLAAFVALRVDRSL